MGLSHSPSIITENLEFYIDPSNTRSYPGFGNTIYNIVNSSMGCTFVNFTANPIDNAGNRSIFFDNASNNAVFIPSSNLQFGSSDFTIQFWFKFPGYSNNNGKVIFSDSWGPSNGGFLFYTYQSGGTEKILFYSTSTDGSWNIALEKDLIVSPSFNTWYNVAVTRTGNVFTLYANGQITNTFSSSLSLRNTGLPYSLGASPTAANASKCSIGSVFIYRNKGLSAAEINQNYHATKKKYLIEENIVTNGLILNLDPGNPYSYSGSGNTIFDLAGFGNTGTLTNGPTFSSLNSGSLSYDGTNDYMYVQHNNSQNLTYITVSAWFNFPVVPFSGLGINKETSFRLMSAESYTTTAGGRLGGSWGTGVGPGATTLSPNRWYQIVMTADGTTQKLYVNGSLDYTLNNSALASINSNVLSFATYHFGSSNFMNCQMSQALIYNRALSATEIQQNYNATKGRFLNALPPVRNGLVLELDALSYSGFGNTWNDLSGSNNTSALTNGPTYTFSNSLSNFSFDGSNDYVVVNSNADLLSKTEYTKFIFFYATSFSTANNLISGGVSGTNHAFWLNFSNRLYAGHNASWSTVTGSTTLSTNTWYCGAVTYSNVSGWKLYLNGVLDGTSATSTTFDNSGELLIAAYANANVFTGRISLAMVYNRALSAYEIKQNFDFYRTRYGI